MAVFDGHSAGGLERVPHRRTLDRRLREIGDEAETQSAALGLALTLEEVTDSPARDGSAFKAAEPVWHKKDTAVGRIPDGLTGLDTDADWIQSTYHGWVYGYKAHVTISIAPTTVLTVLSATVTGRAGESHVLQDHLDDLPPLVESLLLEAGYDDAERIADCQERGLEVLVPLAKSIGQSPSQARRDRAAYLASPEGKSRYRSRGSSIEPFFATIQSLFYLDPLPGRGSVAVSAFIPLVLFAWNLIVLFNFALAIG
ncbi:MAG: transposase [Chloroflexota bacterium]